MEQDWRTDVPLGPYTAYKDQVFLGEEVVLRNVPCASLPMRALNEAYRLGRASRDEEVEEHRSRALHAISRANRNESDLKHAEGRLKHAEESVTALESRLIYRDREKETDELIRAAEARAEAAEKRALKAEEALTEVLRDDGEADKFARFVTPKPDALPPLSRETIYALLEINADAVSRDRLKLMLVAELEYLRSVIEELRRG